MIEEIRHKFNRLTFYTILFTFLGVSMTFIIFSSVAQPTRTCPAGQFVIVIGTVSDNCSTGGTDQIAFDSATLANATLNAATLTSPALTLTNTEEIMVASLGQGGFITSIMDTQSLTYTRALTKTSGPFPQNILEIWSAFYNGTTGASDAITVNWNFTGSMMFFAATYKNAVGIGNATGTVGGAGTTSFTIETEKSGSAIFGASSLPGIGAGTVPTCGSLKPTPGTGLVQRIAGCSVLEPGSPPGFAVNGDTEDNITALPNNNFFTYSETTAQATSPTILGAAELVSKDAEPKNPNFNNFCTTTNGLCVTTQYTINAVKEATGVNALNKALALGTQFCTGITTSPITIGTHPLFGWGQYGGVDLNITNAKLQVQLYISTGVPSTVFGSGLCSSPATLIGVGYIFFPIAGSLSATNAFTVSINGNCGTLNTVNCIAGTYYGWLEITAQNFASGSLGFDQVVNQAYSQSSVNLMEIK